MAGGMFETDGCVSRGWMRLMVRDHQKQRVLAKLANARKELEDALNLTAPAARYDPVVLREATRKELSVMVDDLYRILQQLEGTR
jgi:hypothetical protein